MAHSPKMATLSPGCPRKRKKCKACPPCSAKNIKRFTGPQRSTTARTLSSRVLRKLSQRNRSVSTIDKVPTSSGWSIWSSPSAFRARRKQTSRRLQWMSPNIVKALTSLLGKSHLKNSFRKTPCTNLSPIRPKFQNPKVQICSVKRYPRKGISHPSKKNSPSERRALLGSLPGIRLSISRKVGKGGEFLEEAAVKSIDPFHIIFMFLFVYYFPSHHNTIHIKTDTVKINQRRCVLVLFEGALAKFLNISVI